MAKWQLKDTTGVSIGGEFYQANSEGVVDVPDNVGLTEYGFVPVRDVAAETAKRAEAEAAQAAHEAELAAAAEAEAEAAKQAAAEAEKAAKKGAK